MRIDQTGSSSSSLRARRNRSPLFNEAVGFGASLDGAWEDFNMYGIQFGQTIFAALRLDNLQVRRGLGHGLFVGTLRVHNNQPATAQKQPYLIHVSGEIRNAGSDHIAEIRRTTLRWWQNRPEDTIYLHAPVSFRALSMLTDARKSTNEAVQLTFALSIDVEGREEWQSQTVDLTQRVAASDWLALLEHTRHTSFHVVEVPLEGLPVPAGLKTASDRYREAIRHLELCQWDDAIAECRQVIEDLAGPIGPAEVPPPWAQYADQQKTTWTFSQRCAAIRAILRHATHEAHHGGNQFTANQAKYVVDLTGVALRFYGQQLH